MPVLGDGRNEGKAAVGSSRIEVEGTLLHTPAEVSAAGDEIDFFHFPLSDIGTEQTSGRRIEGKAPGIAHAERIDLLANAPASTDERIARGNAVLSTGAVGAERVDTVDLAEKLCFVLPVAEDALWIARASAGVTAVIVIGAAAIARREVKKSIRTEVELSAVVIELRLVEAEQDALGKRIGDVRIARAHEILGDSRTAVDGIGGC